jgi:hypothetical protein
MWIDTERGAEEISYLRSMARLNMMEEDFYGRRMAECQCSTYFAMHREMDHEENEEKREEKRAWKREKACRAKEAFARGGKKVLIKGKWSGLNQD